MISAAFCAGESASCALSLVATSIPAIAVAVIAILKFMGKIG